MNNDYTVKQVAKLLGISSTTVYSFENRGLLKRVEDPHRLQGGIRYHKEQVDELVEEKKNLESAGRSISDFSQHIGVYSGKVSEAIKALNLDVKKVESYIKSSRLRYALTPEQEKEIIAYLNRQKTTRAKRNHLYFPSSDLALYQSFLIAGEQPVRLKQNEEKELGFQLDSENFITYVNAIRSLDIEPRYSIHQERKLAQLGFTDLTVPMGKKIFYQILDTLYAVCGVENFNAEIQRGNLVISIRNGQYSADSFSEAILQAMNEYKTSGEIEFEDGILYFSRTEKIIQIQVSTETYLAFEREAQKSSHSVKDWIQLLLEEKGSELKNINK